MSDHQESKSLLLAKKEVEERFLRTDKHIHHRDKPLSADFAEQASEMENLEVLAALGKEEFG